MPQFKKILVPTDFSEGSRAAIEEAIALAKPAGAELDLVNVWEVPIAMAPDTLVLGPSQAQATIIEYMRNHASQEMELLQAELSKRGVKTRGVLLKGDPATAILEQAEKGYDLIVIGTHGRRGLARLLLGSVAERVVRSAPCAVLTVKTPAPGGE